MTQEEMMAEWRRLSGMPTATGSDGMPAPATSWGTPAQNEAALLGMLGFGGSLLTGLPVGLFAMGAKAAGLPFDNMDPMAKGYAALKGAFGALSSPTTVPSAIVDPNVFDRDDQGFTGLYGSTAPADPFGSFQGYGGFDAPGGIGTFGDLGSDLGGFAAGGYGGGFDAGGDFGGAVDTAVSDFAHGGLVEGEGGPMDDEVEINASDGEYVVPADVVAAVGVEFFESLKQRFHKPTRGKR